MHDYTAASFSHTGSEPTGRELVYTEDQNEVVTLFCLHP